MGTVSFTNDDESVTTLSDAEMFGADGKGFFTEDKPVNGVTYGRFLAACAMAIASAARAAAGAGNAVDQAAAADLARAAAEAAALAANAAKLLAQQAVLDAGAQVALAVEEADRAELAANSVTGSTVPDPAPDNAAMVAYSTGSAVTWARGSSAAVIPVAADVLLMDGLAYRLTAAAPVTVTLPADPATGAAVRLIDAGLGVTHTVARNGRTIMGAAEDLVLDVPGLVVDVWFNGADWRLA
ncbi:hypothetical protein [Caenispirillum bisanense]|uniref:Uncharacterized protein n=1 Tax=Caenispirillum bisanense TaxID=414052 RepID=A0A286GYX9_9PROT|nr:hypothetical protein [Caenispirillum bisanense]SOE00691.1 hypothetical protein SAMN05421508_113102 [Caenispirillum bisanense]